MDLSQPTGRWTLAATKLIAWCAVAQMALLTSVPVAVGYGFTRPDTIWIAVPLIVGLADIVLIPSVGSTVRPLPFGAGDDDVRRISTGALRTVLVLRLALAEAAVLFGLVSAVLGHSLVPYLIGCVFALPLLLGYAYPSTRVVEAVRQRLESGGVIARFDTSPAGHKPRAGERR